jgi:hypothetical protein
MEVRMIRRSALLTGLATVALLPAACTDSRSNPAGPTNARSASLTPNANFEAEREQDEDDRGFLRLVSVVGPGSGRIRATRIPHPTTPGNFAVHIEIRIRHAKPNTAYVGQRAAEAFAPPATPPGGFPVATLTDGSCQRGLAIAPWSTLVPPASAFTTFPDQAHGLPALIIATDGEGNGAADFVVAFAFPLPLFDVMFRVIENSPAPTSMLQSDCTVLPLL